MRQSPRNQAGPAAEDDIGTSGKAVDDDPRIIEAMEIFLEELEAGRHPRREDILARFPEIAGELDWQLEGLEFLHGAASQMTDATARQAESSQDLLHAKETLGDYQLVRPIGRGGMGIVYEAEQLSLGRTVAVKVLPFAALLDERQLKRFRNEARVAATLDHPNIVPVYFVGEARGVHFYAMKLIEGQSMAELINELRGDPGSLLQNEDQALTDPHPASAETGLQSQTGISTHWPHRRGEFFTSVAKLGIQAAEALEHAHQIGILHRDIKPGNLLIDRNGTLWITDFGLASMEEGEVLTRTGGIVGTAAYMSPEQASGNRAIDARSDIYSLGASLYDVFLPHRREPDSHSQGRLPATRDREVSGLRRHDPHIPRDLETIVLKALAVQPADRYQTAQGMSDDLQRFVQGRAIQARRLSPLERGGRWLRRHHRAATVVAAACGLALAGLIVGLVAHSREVTNHARQIEAALDEKNRALSAAESARDLAQQQRRIAQEHLGRAEASELRIRRMNYRSDLQHAYDDWHRGQWNQASRLLARHIPPSGETDLRGPEWHVLNAEVRAKIHPLGSHTGSATECVLFPGGRMAATAGEDGRVHLWDLNSLSKLRTITPHIGPIHAVAVSPDGQTLAVGGTPLPETSDVSHVYLLDPMTGSILSALQNHQTTIESIVFSPNGRLIAAGSRYSEVKLSAVDGEHVHSFPAERRNETVAFSPDGQYLAALWDDHTIRFWDCLTGKVHHEIPYHHSTGQFRWDASGHMIAASTNGYPFADILDVESGRHIAFLRGPDSPARQYSAIAFTPDSRALVAGDVEGQLHQWPIREAQWRESLATTGHVPGQNPDLRASGIHSSRVTCVAVTDEHQIVTTCDDGSVSLLTPKGIGSQSSQMERHSLATLCVDSAGTRVFSGRADGTIITSDGLTNRVTTLCAVSNDVDCVCLSYDGRLLAAIDCLGQWSVFDAHTGEAIWQPAIEPYDTISQHQPFQIVLSSHGSRLAVTGPDDVIHVWDVSQRKRLWSHPQTNVKAMVFAPDEQLIAYGGTFETMNVRETASGRLLHSIRGGLRTQSVDFSPHGRFVVSGNSDGAVRLVDLESGDVRILRGHRGRVQCVAFSSDGTSLISTDNMQSSESIRLWDVVAGEEFGAIPNPLTPHDGRSDYRVVSTRSSVFLYDIGAPTKTLHFWSFTSR